jgi:hypothetical protein
MDLMTPATIQTMGLLWELYHEEAMRVCALEKDALEYSPAVSAQVAAMEARGRCRKRLRAMAKDLSDQISRMITHLTFARTLKDLKATAEAECNYAYGKCLICGRLNERFSARERSRYKITRCEEHMFDFSISFEEG